MPIGEVLKVKPNLSKKQKKKVKPNDIVGLDFVVYWDKNKEAPSETEEEREREFCTDELWL